MFKLIDRYIYKELLYPFLFGVTAFTMILAGGGILPSLVGEASRFGIPFNEMIKLLLFRLPEMMVYTFPMSMLLAALLAFGRLSGDSEVTAFKAGKISLFRLIIPALLIGIIVTCATFVFNEFVVPWSNTQGQKLTDTVRHNPPLAVKENVNMTEYDKGYLKRITFARKLTGQVMEEAAVSEFDQGQFRRVIFAKKAIWKQGGGWIFQDGIMHQFSLENPESVFVVTFKEEEINLNVKPEELRQEQRDPKSMNYLELKRYIELMNRTGSNVNEMLLELNRKIALPFASFLFVLLGAPLGLRPQRSGGAIGLGLSIIVVFCYYLLTSVGVWLTLANLISPFAGAWLANVLIAATGWYLLQKATN
ncbi:MAG: LptF/LptG family permease [Candidatus Margulisiibacteriota bacterium]|jgi:lipopolysaccharide export system permease protein